MKRRTSRSSSFLRRFLAVLVLLGISGVAFAQMPKIINYQGRLKNPTGTPVSGPMPIVFSLYSTASAAGPLWRETQNVTLQNGLFNAGLGSVMPLELPFDRQYFLGVKTGADPERRPLQPLTSVPYARRALVAERLVPTPSRMDLNVVGVGTLEVLAWSHGASLSGKANAGAGGGYGKPNVQDLSITTYSDNPVQAALLQYVSSGQLIGSIVLTNRGYAASGTLQIIRLGNALVSSISTGGSGGQDRLTANITFNFQTIRWEYYDVNPDGTTVLRDSSGYDIKSNRPI